MEFLYSNSFFNNIFSHIDFFFLGFDILIITAILLQKKKALTEGLDIITKATGTIAAGIVISDKFSNSGGTDKKDEIEDKIKKKNTIKRNE